MTNSSTAKQARRYPYTVSAVFRRLTALGMVTAAFTAHGQTQTTTYKEISNAIRAPNAVAKLGADLFGDQVNLYTGRLEFVQKDLGLPGNSRLPVEVGRRLAAGKSSMGGRLFGRWDLEIPHIVGVFSLRDGWKSTDGSYSRCSSFGPPPTAIGENNQGTFLAEEFWQGTFLYVPGQGEQQMLRRATDNTAAPGNAPASYPVVTSKFWSFSCLATLANGTGSGQGFLAYAPDGTTYRFDHMVSYDVLTLYKGSGAAALVGGSVTSDSKDAKPVKDKDKDGKPGTDPTPVPQLDIEYRLPRKEIWLFPTVITDRFGNTVRYNYDAANPGRLTSIVGSDGRTLTFGYQDAISSKVITSVSNGVNTWNYVYRTLGGTDRDLDRVNLPDGSSWQLSDTNNFFMDLDMAGGESCDQPGFIYSGPLTGSMVHPSGATGTFTLSPVTHGRSNVLQDCRMVLGGGMYPRFPKYFYTYALTGKSISGAGLSGMNWSYAYGPPNASFEPCGAGCPQSKTVTVTDPRGDQTRYTYGNLYRVSEGQLQQVDTGWNGSSAVSTKTTRYRAPGVGPYPETAGYAGYNIGDNDALARYMPADQQIVSQQGVTFRWEATAFDTLVRPTAITKASSLGYTRNETTAYSDHIGKWILGQLQSVTESSTGKVMESNVYNATTATLTSTSKFGLLQKSFTYNTDGTVATSKDGRNNTTTFSNYKAGIPQTVTYPNLASESATVDSLGQVVAIRNAANTASQTTNLEYDPVGRLKKITHPVEAAPWNATTLTAEQMQTDEYGIPAGHWRQTIWTGNALTVTYYDALWRPLLTRSSDESNTWGTLRMIKRSYDHNGNVVFESYPQRDIPNIANSVSGTTTSYDALGRVTGTVSDSELGALSTATAYLPNFDKRVTNARGQQTTYKFMAFDQPGEALPLRIDQPLGVYSDINRDVFGNPKYVIRSGVESRQYVYDANMRLCKIIEPESGATVLTYDAAGNVAWRASGLALPSTTACDDASVPANKKITYTYDTLNRLTGTSFGDASAGITQSYTADGLPLVNTSNGAVWTNEYNARRLLTKETASYGGQTYVFTRSYDANGAPASLVYPSQEPLTVDYAPNALGEPTKVGTFAGNITTYPNGAIASFTYGNAIGHTMTQNTRGLPQQVSDNGILNDVYSYDANGNVTGISDLQQGIGTRSMGYDALDRLTSATASNLWGTATYSYDTVDNLRTSTLTAGGTARTDTHNYSGNRLTSIASNNAQYNLSYGYDAQGNATQRGGQAFVFDIGNRMSSATGKAGYVYDGRGRRIKSNMTNGDSELSLYTEDGKLLYGETVTAGVVKKHVNVYLSGTLLAQHKEHYVHTDGLGSVVARSDAGILSRTYYEPYGLTAGGVQPTLGFTGHFNDGNTGLTYMQQRYYDPVAGRFVSIDPNSVNVDIGATFNRFSYANNNPFRFIDPDGRQARAIEITCMPGNCISVGNLTDVFQDIKRGGSEFLNRPVDSALSNTKDWINDRVNGFKDTRQERLDLISAANHGDRRAQDQLAVDIAMGFVGSTSMKIAGGHAFDKHVLGVGAIADDPLFRGIAIRTRAQFEKHVSNIMKHPTEQKSLNRGRTAYWHEDSGTVVIHNPRSADGGTAFQPNDGKAFYDQLR